MSKTPSRRAYSYIRFSHPAQAEGGSLKRQLERSLTYCKRNGLALDESLTLHDLGVSAFRGKNAKQGHLAAFLEAVRIGRVPAGSLLIVESVDRISRQGIDEGYDLCKQILKSGVSIVTLSPEREYGPESVKGLTKGALELLIILERAHEESAIKSDRRRDGWRQARDRARSGGGPMLRTCPAWLEVRDGGFREKPAAVAAVRRVYELARSGMGVHAIAAALNAEKVPPIGRKGEWVKAYVYRILRNPAAMGAHQPNKQIENGSGVVPSGEPIPKYYPAVVSEQEWNEAQAVLQSRGGDFDGSGKFRRGGKGVRGAGRRGKGEPNLFTGLLTDALTGERMNIVGALGRKAEGPRKRYRYLCPTKESGKTHGRRVDYGVFEAAVLALLKELKPADIAPEGKHSNGRQAEISQLSGRLLDLDSRLERTKARAKVAKDFDEYLDLIEQLSAERREVSDRKKELEREEDGRQPADLGEAQTLIGMLAEVDPARLPGDATEEERAELARRREDLRRRLRTRIAQLVSGVWLAIVRRGLMTLCAVQVRFRGGDRLRTYLILHRSANRFREGGWDTFSNLAALVALDMRRPEHAKRVEKFLTAVDLSDLKKLADNRPAGATSGE